MDKNIDLARPPFRYPVYVGFVLLRTRGQRIYGCGMENMSDPTLSPVICCEHGPMLMLLQVVVMSASDVVPTEAPGAGVDCDPYCVLEVLPEGSRMKEGAAENTKYKTVCKVRVVELCTLIDECCIWNLNYRQHNIAFVFEFFRLNWY